MSVKVITELDGRPQASGCPRPLIRTGSAAAAQQAASLSPRPDFYLPPPLPQATRGHTFIWICHQSDFMTCKIQEGNIMVREQKQIFTITNTQYTKHIRYFTCSTAVVPSHLTAFRIYRIFQMAAPHLWNGVNWCLHDNFGHTLRLKLLV